MAWITFTVDDDDGRRSDEYICKGEFHCDIVIVIVIATCNYV